MPVTDAIVLLTGVVNKNYSAFSPVREALEVILVSIMESSYSGSREYYEAETALAMLQEGGR